MGKRVSLMSSCSSIISRSFKPPIARASLYRWFSHRRLLFTSRPSSARAAARSVGPAADNVDLSHVRRYLVENFPSLYTGIVADEDDCLSNDADDDDDICRVSHISRPGNVSPRLSFPPPHAVRASARFFVPSPRAGAGSSLLEEARLSAASASSYSSCSSGGTSFCPPSSSLSTATARSPSPSPSPSLSSDGTAVEKFSKEPYHDFVRSMTDMVEAHRLAAGRAVESDFMEELLFSYLELNDRRVYKDILRAFADVSSTLRRRTGVQK